MPLKRVSIRSELFPTREKYPFSLEVLQRTAELEFPTAVTLFVPIVNYARNHLPR
jgi:predicted ATPase